jgi:hypothetical protein
MREIYDYRCLGGGSPTECSGPVWAPLNSSMDGVESIGFDPESVAWVWRLFSGKPEFIPASTKQSMDLSVSGQGWVRMAKEGDPKYRLGDSEVWEWTLTRKNWPCLKPLLGEVTINLLLRVLMRTTATPFASLMAMCRSRHLLSLGFTPNHQDNASTCPVCQSVLTIWWGFVLGGAAEKHLTNHSPGPNWAPLPVFISLWTKNSSHTLKCFFKYPKELIYKWSHVIMKCT